MPYDLIIFDCDGTLVNSEYLHNAVIADMLTAMGHTRYTPEYCVEAFAGKGMGEVLRALEADLGKPLPVSFLGDYVQGVNDGLAEHMKIIHGVEETLAHLEGRVKMCVGSNGERINVTRIIEAAGFTRFFPDTHIFTKDMVKHAKPAPDLFLLAADKMGVASNRTLVIEDSPTGTAAGVAAGMTVIGFTGAVHDHAAQARLLRDAGAHHVTANFLDIISLADKGISLLTA